MKIALCAFVLISVLLPVNAYAQPVCLPHNQVMKQITKVYGEKLKIMGVSHSGELLEITVAPNGSWSVFLTTPTKITCLLVAGSDWIMAPKPREWP
jgi:hypothetical protein